MSKLKTSSNVDVLKKVRVQLLDEVTGAVIEEVDVLTSADSVTFADGETFQNKLDSGALKGDKGNAGAKGDQGEQGIQGPKGDTGATGAKGEKGDVGAPFQIKKIYVSIEEMNNDFEGEDTTTFDFVIIETENVNDEDNSKLYMKTETEWKFITDLSGAQGIQGPKGETGTAGAKGDKGETGEQGPKGNVGEKGDSGELIRVGNAYETAQQVKLFFKLVD
ncbi:MAG: hypothetical protein R3Y64_07725 [Peptostreptococcaceae bacterium]